MNNSFMPEDGENPKEEGKIVEGVDFGAHGPQVVSPFASEVLGIKLKPRERQEPIEFPESPQKKPKNSPKK